MPITRTSARKSGFKSPRSELTTSNGDRIKAATYGSGVCLRPSTLPGATASNRGLFATRKFKQNSYLSEYTGRRISRTEALKLQDQGRATHVKGLSYFCLIDGDQHPKIGQGIAQFANDGTDSDQNNCVFKIHYLEGKGGDRCFLKATREIQAGEEIFVGYGNNYWISNSPTGEKIIGELDPEEWARLREEQDRKERDKAEELAKAKEEKNRRKQLKRQAQQEEKDRQREEAQRLQEAQKKEQQEALVREREEKRALRQKQKDEEKRQREEKRRLKQAQKEKERVAKETARAKSKLLAQEKEAARFKALKRNRRLQMKKRAMARQANQRRELLEQAQVRKRAHTAMESRKQYQANIKAIYDKSMAKWIEEHPTKSYGSAQAWTLWAEAEAQLAPTKKRRR